MLAALVIMGAELRYFFAEGTPEATGTSYSNLGLLILMGLPLVVVVAGALQAISGLTFHQQMAAFSAQSLLFRVVISIGVVVFSVAMTAVAVLIA